MAPKRKTEGNSFPLDSRPLLPATYKSIRNRTLPEGWGLLQFGEDEVHPGSHPPTTQQPPRGRRDLPLVTSAAKSLPGTITFVGQIQLLWRLSVPQNAAQQLRFGHLPPGTKPPAAPKARSKQTSEELGTGDQNKQFFSQK